MPRPELTRRDQVYELLRAAGARGVTLYEFQDHELPCPGSHIESLRFEGHGIESLSGKTAEGRFLRRWYLVKDAWSGGEVEPVWPDRFAEELPGGGTTERRT
jgi:hypothetical protein